MIRKRKFQIGDKVKVTGMPILNFAPGGEDELGTEKPFNSMLGKVYTVRGFDTYFVRERDLTGPMVVLTADCRGVSCFNPDNNFDDFSYNFLHILLSCF